MFMIVYRYQQTIFFPSICLFLNHYIVQLTFERARHVQNSHIFYTIHIEQIANIQTTDLKQTSFKTTDMIEDAKIRSSALHAHTMTSAKLDSQILQAITLAGMLSTQF